MLSKLASGFGKGVARNSKNVGAMTQGARKFHSLYNPHPTEEDATPLDVQFWRGKSAIPFENFQIDCSKYDMSKIVGKNDKGEYVALENNATSEAIKANFDEKFRDVGAIHFINTGFTEMDQMDALRKHMINDQMFYEGGANLRLPLEGNVYDTGAPKEADIQYHHEMAYVGQSCKWVAFAAINATNNPLKGATYLSLNNPATEEMMETKLGQKLKDKGVCYVRKLPDKK